MITPYLLTAIFIRILSLYLLSQGLAILPMSLSISSDQPSYLFTTPELMIILLSFILWIFTKQITNIILKNIVNVPQTIEMVKMNEDKIINIILILFGFYLVVTSISVIFGKISGIIFIHTIPTQEITAIQRIKMTSANISGFIKNGTEAVFGILLILFVNRLTLWINNLFK